MKIRILLLALCAWTALGCGLAKEVELADGAVAVFHEKYAAAVWGDLYDEATDELRNELAQTDFANAFASVHARLGDVHRTKRVGFQVTESHGAAFVALEYETEFEYGSAIEQFVWRITDGRARLLSYTVTPAGVR